MRPSLTKEITVKEFKNYYWLKKELQVFCRENRISPSGSKRDIAERVEIFLRTGEIQKRVRKSKEIRKADFQVELSLDTVITEDHRCSQKVRAFFKTVIPNFHFSTYIQNYFKDNIGKTYLDVVTAWNKEEARRKDPSYKTKIGLQFEYNQFIRDYFANPKNQEKRREKAVKAWHTIKKLPGSNKYNA